MLLNAVKVADPLDPVTPEFIQNPYPFYKLLREHNPVIWNESKHWWILTKYDDVLLSFRDPRISTRPEPPLHRLANKTPARMHCPVAGILERIQEAKAGWLPGRNPPVHTHMKRMVSAAFAPARLEALRPFIENLCNGILDEAKARGELDVFLDFAVPIPFIVIAKLIGLPSEDLPKIRHWCRSIGPLFDIDSSEEDIKEANTYIEECTNFLLPLVKRRRKEMREDLLGDLLRTDKDGFKLTDRQVAANTVLFTLAGFETTEGLIGNGVLALLQNPDQLDFLRKNPDEIEAAVEEMVRYDAPSPFEPRVVSEPVEIRGQILKPGDRVIPMTGSANRDEDVFENPDKFDIRRKDNKHLGFGAGLHYCIGANLSRLEAQIAINLLLQRMPNLRLATDNVVFGNHFRPRKLTSLPVAF